MIGGQADRPLVVRTVTWLMTVGQIPARSAGGQGRPPPADPRPAPPLLCAAVRLRRAGGLRRRGAGRARQGHDLPLLPHQGGPGPGAGRGRTSPAGADDLDRRLARIPGPPGPEAASRLLVESLAGPPRAARARRPRPGADRAARLCAGGGRSRAGAPLPRAGRRGRAAVAHRAGLGGRPQGHSGRRRGPPGPAPSRALVRTSQASAPGSRRASV